MLAIDTNVLIRYLINDDPLQAQSAKKIIQSAIDEHNQVFISIITLIESIWVFESVYSFPKKELLLIIADLLDNDAFKLEDEALVQSALNYFRKGSADFSDYTAALIALKHNCSKLVTFDKGCSDRDLFSIIK